MTISKVCSVVGCDAESHKTLGRAKVSKIFNLKPGERKAHLCKQHYKEYKKKTRKQRELDRAGWV